MEWNGMESNEGLNDKWAGLRLAPTRAGPMRLAPRGSGRFFLSQNVRKSTQPQDRRTTKYTAVGDFPNSLVKRSEYALGFDGRQVRNCDLWPAFFRGTRSSRVLVGR